jgi:hypothetical protein
MGISTIVNPLPGERGVGATNKLIFLKKGTAKKGIEI